MARKWTPTSPWTTAEIRHLGEGAVLTALNDLEAGGLEAHNRIQDLLEANNRYLEEARAARAELREITGMSAPTTVKHFRKSQAAIDELLDEAGYKGERGNGSVRARVKTVLGDLAKAKEQLAVAVSYEDLSNAREDSRRKGEALAKIRLLCNDMVKNPLERTTTELVYELVETVKIGQDNARRISEVLANRGAVSGGRPLSELVDIAIDARVKAHLKSLEDIAASIGIETRGSTAVDRGRMLAEDARKLVQALKAEVLSDEEPDQAAEASSRKMRALEIDLEHVLNALAEYGFRPKPNQTPVSLFRNFAEHFAKKTKDAEAAASVIGQERDRHVLFIHELSRHLGLTPGDYADNPSIEDIKLRIYRALDGRTQGKQPDKPSSMHVEWTDLPQAAKPAPGSHVFPMFLCESADVILQPRTYHFFVDPGCERCLKLARLGRPPARSKG